MTPEFKRAVEITFEVEGYDKVITDSGGLTKWGISQRAFPNLDIRSLTREDAQKLYWLNYWQPVRADDLSWPLSMYVYDAAVNQGCDAAARMLQAAVSAPIDGILGPQTMKKAKAANPAELAALFMAKRCQRYVGTRGFDQYGYGWFARLFRVAAKAS